MVERTARVWIKVNDQGNIIVQVQGTLTKIEYIAAFELLKAKAITRLADLTDTQIKMEARSVA